MEMIASVRVNGIRILLAGRWHCFDGNGRAMTLLAGLSPNTTHSPVVYFHTKAMEAAYSSSIGLFMFRARGAERSLL